MFRKDLALASKAVIKAIGNGQCFDDMVFILGLIDDFYGQLDNIFLESEGYSPVLCQSLEVELDGIGQ